MSDYRDANRDPITDEPGAHPLGTGVGAALGGAAAGAAAGAFGGPVGAVVGGDLAPVFPDPSYSQRNAASLTGERRAWAA